MGPATRQPAIPASPRSETVSAPTAADRAGESKKNMARIEQLFDTTLEGKPAPDWMVRGIPAKDKGKDQLQQVVPWSSLRAQQGRNDWAE
jgi:hypothetical protein